MLHLVISSLQQLSHDIGPVRRYNVPLCINIIDNPHILEATLKYVRFNLCETYQIFRWLSSLI